ncbi:uncharacterized protein A1O9_02123 [Exophiala aquamarina CBS 119918]|uniref:Filamentation protein n=1 Tax=Exophiala aquamarina CBS 119918 TaxID=1182545 RepID=A0A072PLC4_9EURO|nr:uncharacterized protein A1O9_02123 [Exophiala aquamarina CBS 119918]KEF60562.1 hypothetical protein A1O9_02123 [Exophiala aquamarina CBS 119918]
MSVQHHNEKAQRYIQQLDVARITSSWKDVPELIRKITKHASGRKRLLQVAKAEVDVINYATAARRPGTSESTKPSLQSVSALQAEIKPSEHPDEETLQGQSCLLWARWIGYHQKETASSTLTFDPARAAADANSTWTKICVVKAAYIQGMLLSQEGLGKQGNDVYQTILPWLDSNRSLVVSTPQLLYWAQQLLGQVALGNRAPDDSALDFDGSSNFRLQAFRHWAVLTVKSKPVSSLAYGNARGHLSSLTMWRTYYRFMSGILHQRPGAGQNVAISRSELAVELRRVETSYESELLRNAHFPKAIESNKPVEDWVEEVVGNWLILCGSNWTESDLGDGGRNSVGRNVLEILYRAATKTFHSTLILRRLFQLHKALADFDLAYKALDTYVELMDSGRARAAKSNEAAMGQDSDELFLQTISEAIEGLCSHGGQAEAEKAYDLCLKVEGLLDELGLFLPHEEPNGGTAIGGRVYGDCPLRDPLSPTLTDTVYRAIGIGKSQWARWTPFSENRSSLQSEAIGCLQKASRQDVSPHQQLKTMFALACLLAETREIDQAVAIAKRALASQPPEHEVESSYQVQRNLIPFWHLLSLLLTSRQDFGTASQSCAAAFEQFEPSDVIFGTLSDESGVSETSGVGPRKGGLVDDMEGDELRRIIEIRITELALTELNEGHEHAVNSSNDLLGLYSRLFGRLGGLTSPDNSSKPKLMQPPKSSAGTVKSSHASLFSRRKVGQSNESTKGSRTVNGASIPEEATRPNTRATQATDAPTIHVTNEDEAASPPKHRLFRTSHEHNRNEKRNSPGKPQGNRPRHRLSRSRSRGRREDVTSHESNDRPSYETGKAKGPNPASTEDSAQDKLGTIPSQEVPAIRPETGHDTSERAKQPLKPIPHNLGSHDEIPLPAKHDVQPPEQDVRLPVGKPNSAVSDMVPRFPRAMAQRQAWTVLVKIWLVIATLYRRSKMFEDSREACDEAAKVALRVETLVASVESSARAFCQAGWGVGSKSSDELWADVYFERAELLLAIAREREEKEGGGISEGVREAVEQYEQCLMYFHNHAGGMVGLSNVLLDYYERKVELGKKVDGAKPALSAVAARTAKGEESVEERPRRHRRDFSRQSIEDPVANGTVESTMRASEHSQRIKEDELKKTPENLNRLAARDRAYGLLTTLTKLGSGWDNSEAWLALARANELGGEVEKAKEILWWCVELEDTRPIRHWHNIGGGYVL